MKLKNKLNKMPRKRPRPRPRPRLHEECIICFYPFAEAEVCAMDCDHYFHSACLKEWFDTSGQDRCPVCTKGKRVRILKLRPRRKYCCCEVA